MSRSAIIQRFLDALSAADLDTWGALWADDGVMTLPFADPGADRHVGRQACVDYFAAGLARFSPFVFDELAVIDTAGVEAVAEWRGRATMLSSGGNYDNRYIAVFSFDDTNKITEYRQYLNPVAFDRAAGTA